MMRFHIITLFPELFDSFLKTSLIEKAQGKNLISVSTVNLRDFSDPPHYRVDDTPYGGGGGMLLKPEPLARAIIAAKEELPNAKVVYLSPAGETLSQKKVEAYSESDQPLIFICGRYEGIDQRIIDLYIDYELSIGDYVLMGGDLPCMIVIEAITRLREEVLGNSSSPVCESHSSYPGDTAGRRLLEAPHYTRPAVFMGLEVPKVLLTGDHARIEKWRHEEALERTRSRRPDLLKG